MSPVPPQMCPGVTVSTSGLCAPDGSGSLWQLGECVCEEDAAGFGPGGASQNPSEDREGTGAAGSRTPRIPTAPLKSK